MPASLVVTDREGRSPFQTFLLAWLVVAGIPLTLGITSSKVTESLGHPWVNIWGILLTVTSAISLTGVYWPKSNNQKVITGLFIERAGLFGLGGACVLWVFLIITNTGVDGIFTAAITLGLVLACFVQIRHINKLLKQIEDILSKPKDSP